MLSALWIQLPELIASQGYWLVALIVGLESMGIPLPGETALVTAAIFAGATGRLDITGVVGAATFGAVVGDNVGYWLGREIGLPLVNHYGRYVGMTEGKVKLGRLMFDRYGAPVVFFGRFIAVLRVLAAFLAGVNHMTWPRFFAANVAGGILWASVFGFGAYLLGNQIHRFTGPLGIAALVLAGVAIGGTILLFRRHEHRLLAEAERTYPGRLAG